MSSESLSDMEHSRSRRLRQRQTTALTSTTDSSLYAQVDHKKKRRPPPGYLGRHLGKTRSVDPVTMTKSLSGLEVRPQSSVENHSYLLLSDLRISRDEKLQTN